MLRLRPEQLREKLNKGLHSAYLFIGDDPFLLQESQDVVCQVATTQGFDEYYTVQIDSSSDWQEVFSFCQTKSLFTSRQILILTLPENGFSAAINEQLTTLVGLLHDDLLLMMRCKKLTKTQENAVWFIQLAPKAALVICQTPNVTQLPKWVASRAQQHNLQLDEAGCQLLCYCYEGNLLALVRALDWLSLLWPDGKLTLSRVEQAVNKTAHFVPLNWIDALLAAKSKRALHILQELRFEGNEPIILLRTLQRELILLITLKRQSVIVPLRELLDKHQVYQKRRILITKTINRLSYVQLRQAVHLLTKAELTLKQNYSQSIWSELESLSLLLCCEELTDVFIYA